MSNFEDFKQKAIKVAGDIADVSVELYKAAEEKAKIIAKTKKLQAENALDRSAVKKLYTEIGKTYYAQRKDAPEGEYEQLFAELAASFGRINERAAEIDALRTSVAADAADVDTDAESDAEKSDDAGFDI
ncbi:MAG: hypothetical protein LBT36_02860 [Oscillospiraceae bacterium]|jgi:glutaredoxin 2|nr:hypothetical protein [Oscillospiraceae bacterium]